ncbi:transporter [Pseudomonas sp. 5P_3.1_Bac2]|uniref:SphA family protein n=1 Tax=Pseudomonas sp. 5P_3.1_Bac2 TaxID=2971617 RepID=UPI0021C87621|nr:transporter [Pseudomonas sp. 5P_3.1_Bac2]MCU1719388.1 transporter [Pseudomonas sp. 5P_3.1_Bac2]
MTFSTRSLGVLALAGVCQSSLADSVALPPLALGNSSFMDGVVMPGVLTELPIQYSRSNSAYDAHGHSVPGRQAVRSLTMLPHIAYISEHKLFGANVGAEVLLPLVHLDVDVDNGPSGTRSRQGDLIFNPLLLQWAPVQLFGRPYWQRAVLGFSVPTGSYSSSAQINTGANVWVVNPHYAFTWQFSERWEVSGRLHYAWTSRNNDPADALEAHEVQPGQAFHSNFAVSYALDDNWRVGVAGYHLKQISDDRVDGHRQKDSRERVTGLGPGVMYQKGAQMFYANFYVESQAQNRNEGSQLTLRYLHPF